MFGAMALVVAAVFASALFIVLRGRCPTLSTAILPVYPGASDIIDYTLPDHPDVRAVSHLVVSGNLDDVMEYYHRTMLEQGWEYQGQKGVLKFYRYSRSTCRGELFSDISVGAAKEGIAMHMFMSTKSFPFGELDATESGSE